MRRSIAKANGKFRSAGRANEREFYLTLVKINLNKPFSVR